MSRRNGGGSGNVEGMKASVACGFAIALGSRVAFAQAPEDPSAGGLAPPPAIQPEPEAPPPTPTERDLNAAEREDSGRGLSFLWVDAEAGYELLGLRTFHDGGLVDGALVPSTQHGPVFGGALGARLIALTLGARFRFARFAESSLWSLLLEAGYHVPLGSLEPYVTLGGGYVSLGGFEVGSELRPFAGDLSVRGFDLRGSAGVDYYFGSSLSVGANLSGDLLFLSRPRLKGVPSSDPALAEYAEDGSSVGGATALTLLVGLHF